MSRSLIMSDTILLYYVSNQYVRTINLIIIFGQSNMPEGKNIITEEAQYLDPKKHTETYDVKRHTFNLTVISTQKFTSRWINTLLWIVLNDMHKVGMIWYHTFHLGYLPSFQSYQMTGPSSKYRFVEYDWNIQITAPYNSYTL